MANSKKYVRDGILIGVSLLFLVAIWIRLFDLQVLRNQEFREKSKANSIRVIEDLPGRALICDRFGRVIVENRPSYSISVIPYEARRSPNTISELSTILAKSEEELTSLISTKGILAYQPYKLQRDIDFQVLAAFKARELDLSGVRYQFEPKRHYNYPIAPHTLGYIAEISEAEKKRFPNRKTGDIIGKQGVERTYEDILAGQKGYRFLVVNALGQITSELEDQYIPPQSNGKLYLTLDLDLQLLAEELMEGKRGGLVALDPRNGEILAMVSIPKYNPEIFAGVLLSSDWKCLNEDPDVPLLNRAVQSGYPPASTFKMLTLTAAIEEGIVDLNYRGYCSGGYALGRVYHCFKKEGHGSLNPLEAIEQSCDVFFYRLGHRLGAEKLGYYMKLFGFGSKTGIDLENEFTGIAPDKAYLDKRYGERQWSPGLALNFAIGQGEILATPLQLAHYCGILAARGVKATPHLFLEMHQKDNGIAEYQQHSERIPIQEETFRIVREGMRLVMEGSRGTARRLMDKRWHLAGKTGTAQNPHGEDHSLFISFGPFEDPIIAVAVVVENAGFGSVIAAPIAVQIITRYLELRGVPELIARTETSPPLKQIPNAAF
ncbi:MAG: penicillin-binding protein 2 [bacterium]